MAAPRATQFIALRNLARGSQQVRKLHMTGPATYASPVLTKERPILNLPRDIAGLRAECKKRKIEFSGNKQEVRPTLPSSHSNIPLTQRQLISRLNADELAHSRAFSTVADQTKRPTASSSSESSKTVRHFNTTRSLKAVGDTSTIDFAFLPTVEYAAADGYSQVRVPIIPTNFNPSRTGAHALEDTETVSTTPATISSLQSLIIYLFQVVMKPEISSMSADTVFLPMSDLHDGHAMNVDFHAMADSVAASIRKLKVPVEEQAGLMKQIWSDMVDDMLGSKQKPKVA